MGSVLLLGGRSSGSVSLSALGRVTLGEESADNTANVMRARSNTDSANLRVEDGVTMGASSVTVTIIDDPVQDKLLGGNVAESDVL